MAAPEGWGVVAEKNFQKKSLTLIHTYTLGNNTDFPGSEANFNKQEVASLTGSSLQEAGFVKKISKINTYIHTYIHFGKQHRLPC